MTAHAFVTIRLEDREKIAAYREKAADALARHGGAVVQSSAEVNILEGGVEAPDMGALLSFPDRDAANAWINDPEIADVHALRRESGHSVVFLL